MNLYTKFIIFSAVLTWTLCIFAEFIIPPGSSAAAAIPFLNIAFSNVCHQRPERAVAQGAFHSLVCARCCGIYLGALLISLLNFIWTRTPALLIRSQMDSKMTEKSPKMILKSWHFCKYKWMPAVVLFPIAADVIFYNLGIYDYSKNIAFFTGLLSGSAGFLYILDAFKNFIIERKNRKVYN